MTEWAGGKGSRPRKVDPKKWDEGYQRIFRKDQACAAHQKKSGSKPLVPAGQESRPVSATGNVTTPPSSSDSSAGS
jgi:hypothetical protein